MKKLLAAAVFHLSFSWGCATVDQRHLDAWTNQPVSVLERHPLWGVPDQRIELSSGDVAYVYYSVEPAVSTAISDDMSIVRSPVCKFIFLITEKKVKQMSLRGSCFTSDEQMPPGATATVPR